MPVERSHSAAPQMPLKMPTGGVTSRTATPTSPEKRGGPAGRSMLECYSILAFDGKGTMTSPLELFERQVAAFNAHDLDAFVATYSEDTVVTSFGQTPISGRGELTAHYRRRFEDTTLHCRIDRVEVFAGTWVVAQEYVSSADGGTAVLGVFEIADGGIQRASLLRAVP